MPLLSQQVPREPVPDWLDRLTLTTVSDLAGEAFPLADLLNGSVYYPAARYDGEVVKWLGGAAHSFVYVDFGVGLAAVRADVERGFRGYRLIGLAEISERQLAPRGWRPTSAAWRDPTARTRFAEITRMGLVAAPFALWGVFEREEGLTDEHGPSRFSLLYVGGDGAATYDALYRGNGTAPRYLCLIRPGAGFGGNYTDFYDERGLLAQVVLDDAPARPRYLMTDVAAADGGSLWPTYYPKSIPTQVYRLWEGD